MAQFQKDRSQRPFLYSRTMFAILVLGVLLLSYSLIGMVKKSVTTARARDLAMNQAAALTAKQAKLQSDVDMLQTPEGVEATIRDKFPVVKNGEQLVVIVDPSVKKPDTTTQATKTHSTFVNFFLHLFSRK